MRQSGIIRQFDPAPGVSVATLAYEYPEGFLVHEHAHGSDQLIYATRGLMEVHAERNMWLIPPHFALWIPAQTLHRIRMPGAVSMRTLYFRPGLVKRPERSCAVLHITPLLRELIVETVRAGKLFARQRDHRALRDLTILHLNRASSAPTHVRLPRDARALAIAQSILDCPARKQSLVALCAQAAVSVRTFQRIFRNDVGIDFDSWRRQVRLTRAVQLLVAGETVKQTAFAVGYSQPSAFVEAFRRTFGATPKTWTDYTRNVSARQIAGVHAR
jgi:AraC-like DNA-binding protein